MMRALLFALAAMVLAVPASAEAGEAADPAAVKSATALFDVMRLRDQLRSVTGAQMRQVQDSMLKQMAATVPEMREAREKDPIAFDAMQARIGKAAAEGASEMMTAAEPELIAAMIQVYARNFSAAELDELTAFYHSPIGLKLLDRTPQLTRESVEVSQQIMMKHLPGLMAKMREATAAIAGQDHENHN